MASAARWVKPRVFTVVFGLAMLAIFVASVYLGLLIRDRQREFAELSRYNTTWAISQAALEVAKLETALAELAASGPKADPTEAQIRYDIVANRISVLTNGEVGAMIRTQPDLLQIVDQLRATMKAADKLIDQADQPGVALKLARMFSPMQSPMSQLAGAAHDNGGDLVAEDLRQLRNLQYIFSGLQVTLLGSCLFLIVVLGLNNRMLTRAHREVGDLVVDLRRTGHELGIANHETRRAAEEIQQQNRALQARDRELALQNTRFDAALNNMSQALCMVGADGGLIVANQQFHELFRLPNLPSGTVYDDMFDLMAATGRCDPEMIARMRGVQETMIVERSPGAFFVEGQHADAGKDGTIWAIAVSHQPMLGGGWVATYSDISEQRIAEVQLAHAQKMEAIGNLTGGMAHDFNNLLSVISLNLEFLLSRTDDVEQVREHAGRALHASLRGASLISQLLAFARRQPLAPRLITVNTWIRSITDLLGAMLGESIQIHLDLGAEIWPVNTDATRLETAIANLATNARDAMPLGGELTIVTRNVVVTAAEARGRPDVQPGEFVQITVSDTGVGMPPDVVERIFEPFFTTKAEGHGTGLGLSMVFGFIRQSGGHITVTSVPGQGTTFCLHLPRSAGEVEVEAAPAAPSAVIGGRETILVVEDNDAVRMIATDLLIQLGYEIIEANSPQQALAVLESGRHIDLMFSDVVMPGGMDGFALAEQARRTHPQLRLLLTSGFTEYGERAAHGLGAVKLLGKPFRQSELAHALRDALDSPLPAEQTADAPI